MLTVLIFSFVVTLVHANIASMLNNYSTTISLQQAIPNLTILVNDTLTKSAQSCLANADSSSNVAILVQLTMMHQLLNHNQTNKRSCCPIQNSNNDSKAIIKLGEKLVQRSKKIQLHRSKLEEYV